MRKWIAPLAILFVLGLVAFWFLSAPRGLDPERLAALPAGDPVAGETAFWAGGCGSCHAEKGAKGDAKKLLGGGHRLETPAGIFVTPNISPDPETGIGNWTLPQFANAMLRGVSPDGSHYFPSFPYTSYARMTDKDVADLFAYLKTLEPVARANEAHELALPFRIRRGIGMWKLLFFDDAKIATVDAADPAVARGQYLVEGPAHCGECHTPRTFLSFGGSDTSRWLAGGPAPEGLGNIPNITTGQGGIGAWSTGDIVSYLETGFTPEFDSVGGSMVSVQENMAKLPKSDREAIAAYLKAIPAVASR